MECLLIGVVLLVGGIVVLLICTGRTQRRAQAKKEEADYWNHVASLPEEQQRAIMEGKMAASKSDQLQQMIDRGLFDAKPREATTTPEDQ